MLQPEDIITHVWLGGLAIAVATCLLVYASGLAPLVT